MVDNQRKASLFGNSFQSFLMSSGSVLGHSHSISAIQAECCVKLPFFGGVKCDLQTETNVSQSWNMRGAY